MSESNSNDAIWLLDGVEYRVDAAESFTFGQPAQVAECLNPAWILFPDISERYLTTDQIHRKRKADDIDGPKLTVSKDDSHKALWCCSGKEWYQRHVSPKFQLKYVGPIKDVTIKKITEEIDNLRPRYGGATLTKVKANLLDVSYRQSPAALERGDETITNETGMQLAAQEIIETYHKYLSMALIETSCHINDPSNPEIFTTSHVSQSCNASQQHLDLLRTMSRPMSTVSTDIILETKNLRSSFPTDEGNKVLNVQLRQKANRRLWIGELKRFLHLRVPKTLALFKWPHCLKYPMSLEAQMRRQLTKRVVDVKVHKTTETTWSGTSRRQVKTTKFKGSVREETRKKRASASVGDQITSEAHMHSSNEGHQDSLAVEYVDFNLLAQHLADFEGFSADEIMVDMEEVANNYVLNLVCNDYTPSDNDASLDTFNNPVICQLWTEMIAYGTLFAFVGDWISETRLCIRIPHDNVLLISDPLPNPMVPSDAKDMMEDDVVEECILRIRSKLDSGEHPWATSEGSNLLKVIGGTTLSALRLLANAKNVEFDGAHLFPSVDGQLNPVDLFKQVKKEWKSQIFDANTRRTARLEEIKEMLKQWTPGDAEQQIDWSALDGTQDGDPSGPSGRPDNDGSSEDPPPPGDSSASGVPPSDHITTNYRQWGGANQNLHVAIFDGGIYGSGTPEVFHPYIRKVIPRGFSSSVSRALPNSIEDFHDGSDSSDDSWDFSTEPSSDLEPNPDPVRKPSEPHVPETRPSPVGKTEAAFVALLQHLRSEPHGDIWQGIAIFPGDSQAVEIWAKLAFDALGIERLRDESDVYRHLMMSSNPPVRTLFGCYNNSDHDVGLLLLSALPGTRADQLPSDEVQKAFPWIAHAIKQLHSYGIANLNVSLGNIFIDSDKVQFANLDGAVTNASKSLKDQDMVDLDNLY
ncbi:hypothetical protein K439DRAFT_1656020 [Ramaria rubella]|nr:hypothetical protein K439DRAFT_1656020 [Ramaria rubella]